MRFLKYLSRLKFKFKLGLGALVFCWAQFPPDAVAMPQSGAASPIVLAIRYARYTTSKAGEDHGLAEDEQALLRQTLSGINQIWSRCRIRFVLESPRLKSVPTYRTARAPRALPELFRVRKELSDHRSLLIAVTDPWSPSDPIGREGANAWTSMPGSRDHGVVVEWNERSNPQLLAHELGHYLGLEHEGGGRSRLMAPVVYADSTSLSAEECNSARATALAYWKFAVR